jgi:hypothetical protein
MPNSACNTITPTMCNSTNMSPIEAALAAIELLKPGEKLVYAQIARQYGVEPTTLACRHKGASTSHATRNGINALSTYIKNRSSYDILNALQGKAYHLHNL